MSYYEYMVIAAPRAVPRIRGVRSADERLAYALTDMMNEFGAEGWEYQRSETLTVETREGWLKRAVATQQIVLVFRRWIETETQARVEAPEEPVAPPRMQATRSAPPPAEEPREARMREPGPAFSLDRLRGEGRAARAEPVLRPLPGRDRG